MKKYDVVGLGYCAVDFLGIVPHYPKMDEKVNMLEFSRQGGGITATAMAAVGRLGGRASYIGKVGGDDFGRFILSELAKDDVATHAVVVEPGASSQFSFVIVDKNTGKRTIIWTASDTKLQPDEIRREDVLAGKVLHVDAHFPQAALLAAKWANDAGIPIVMDAGSVRDGSAEIVNLTDYLIASEKFARDFTRESDSKAAALKMLTGRRKLSAVTLGDKGCFYCTAEGVFHQPAFAIQVVDTTGAGDVFHGAFSFGLSQGWTIPQIMEFASAVAALKCTKLGGRAGIPTLEEVRGFIATMGRNPIQR